MKTCAWILDNDEPCGNICEGSTMFCASHNHQLRKGVFGFLKATQKRAQQIEKQKAKNKQPKKAISKNPKDWSNTFLCSDGTRVTQAEINEFRSQAYDLAESYSPTPRELTRCKGCGSPALCHAHIIPQARCKHIGKTELIWNDNNFFDSCFICNSILENPKNTDWKKLKNIEKCLSFIKQHDPELYAKFELSAVNQENPII